MKALNDPRPALVRAAALANFNERLYTAIGEAFKREAFLSVSDWASEHRILTGAESGRYNPLRCPYQCAIQDCFNDPEIREVTWQSAERVGKSTVGANVLGYIIDREPCNILWVMPSREAVADFLKDEVEPMIRASPSLAGKVAAGRTSTGRTNNVRRKTFLGGTVTFVGGGSASPLAFRTVRIVVLDEIDKLKTSAEKGMRTRWQPREFRPSAPISRFSGLASRPSKVKAGSPGTTLGGRWRGTLSVALLVANFRSWAGHCCDSMTYVRAARAVIASLTKQAGNPLRGNGVRACPMCITKVSSVRR